MLGDPDCDSDYAYGGALDRRVLMCNARIRERDFALEPSRVAAKFSGNDSASEGSAATPFLSLDQCESELTTVWICLILTPGQSDPYLNVFLRQPITAGSSDT